MSVVLLEELCRSVDPLGVTNLVDMLCHHVDCFVEIWILQVGLYLCWVIEPLTSAAGLAVVLESVSEPRTCAKTFTYLGAISLLSAAKASLESSTHHVVAGGLSFESIARSALVLLVTI